jgi:hypothetical protein
MICMQSILGSDYPLFIFSDFIETEPLEKISVEEILYRYTLSFVIFISFVYV